MLKAAEKDKNYKRNAMLAIGWLIVFLICFYEVMHAF